MGKLGLYGHLVKQNSLTRTSFIASTLQVQQSIINGVGGIKTMFEKLLLAVTITFSLNFFFQVRVPDRTKTGAIYQQHTETSTTILVTRPEK
ncbi:hypothetical protein [Dendronalium sp. ChiSLP03b]|uniref:hypothetical protein n=1 Tax=Dendronalium sp. ChiSLP03b TaxID=3075381 RepID=UPI002AD835B4|nr:hypothetical protein [Dendronalium sp. ChiSLP03b]